ncbi:MAG TPA: sigma-70 family RNA polymerase sigma factor [Gaiellaceae bacterium]|nr:sigma-70 family RNA polymerase sigma factor [Gaiellaceae bacterium]
MSPLLLRRLSDEQLGSRLAYGEAAAFDELYRRYVHRLSAYGANLLGDAASGDDVAQSALLKAYGALRDGRVPDRVKPWLYRIAHNTAIDLVVRRRELPSAELPERSTVGGEPVERSGALVAALASLPERQRRVYLLRELHGLRIDETATELGLSSSQVEQSLFVARNRLAEHLVFGDRLNCVAVQRLALGPLDGDERRALKTHLRSCPACRGRLGLRGRALGLVPVASFDWLRGLLAGLATGGAPAAVKVGAVVATATFAVGVPAAGDQASHRARPVVRHLVSKVADRAPQRVTHPRDRLVAAPVTVVHDAQPVSRRAGGERGSDGGSAAPVAVETHDGGSDGGGGRAAIPSAELRQTTSAGDGGPVESGSDGEHTVTVPVIVSAPAPAATTSDDGGDQTVTTTTTSTTTTTTGTATTTTDSGGSNDGGGDGHDSSSGDASAHD